MKTIFEIKKKEEENGILKSTIIIVEISIFNHINVRFIYFGGLFFVNVYNSLLNEFSFYLCMILFSSFNNF